jgi:hypothetical protein
VCPFFQCLMNEYNLSYLLHSHDVFFPSLHAGSTMPMFQAVHFLFATRGDE